MPKNDIITRFQELISDPIQSERLYTILWAIRGPDVNDQAVCDEMKDMFVLPLRSVLRGTIESLPSETSKRFLVLVKFVNTVYHKLPYGASHFLNHLKYAYFALVQLGRAKVPKRIGKRLKKETLELLERFVQAYGGYERIESTLSEV